MHQFLLLLNSLYVAVPIAKRLPSSIHPRCLAEMRKPKSNEKAQIKILSFDKVLGIMVDFYKGFTHWTRSKLERVSEQPLKCSRLLSLAVQSHLRSCEFFYRPQRSWAKVIFSQACVKNSVHGWGEGVCLSACWDTPPRSRHHPPWEQIPPRSRHPPPEQTPPSTPDQTPLLGKQTAAYGQRAAGTHPTSTRMHSCWIIF